mmetsp:Transcript_6058/g.9328  ORF Transcript_6058/g.9328 Transcript_6058/m.9328 type:complete len:101 (-) Transcript_6058:189-491(-)
MTKGWGWTDLRGQNSISARVPPPSLPRLLSLDFEVIDVAVPLLLRGGGKSGGPGTPLFIGINTPHAPYLRLVKGDFFGDFSEIRSRVLLGFDSEGRGRGG